MACYRDSFTFLLFYYVAEKIITNLNTLPNEESYLQEYDVGGGGDSLIFFHLVVRSLNFVPYCSCPK
jgi:hypothetical protein